MIQHNAALVDETNAAIEQTESQANELDEIVEIFRIADAHKQPHTPTAPLGRTPKRLSTAAANYLTPGNAAVKADWNEF